MAAQRAELETANRHRQQLQQELASVSQKKQPQSAWDPVGDQSKPSGISFHETDVDGTQASGGEDEEPFMVSSGALGGTRGDTYEPYLQQKALQRERQLREEAEKEAAQLRRALEIKRSGRSAGGSNDASSISIGLDHPEIQEELHHLSSKVASLTAARSEADHARLDAEGIADRLRGALEDQSNARNRAESATRAAQEQLQTLEQQVRTLTDAQRETNNAQTAAESSFEALFKEKRDFEAKAEELQAELESARDALRLKDNLLRDKSSLNEDYQREAIRIAEERDDALSSLAVATETLQALKDEAQTNSLDLHTTKQAHAFDLLASEEAQAALLKDLQRVCVERDSKRDALSAAQEALKAAESELTALHTRAGSESSNLRGELGQAAGAQHSLQLQNAQLKSRCEEMESQTAQAQTMLAEVEGTLAQERNDADRVKRQLKSELAQAKAEGRDAAASLAQNTARLSQLQDEKLQLQGQAAETTANLGVARKEIELNAMAIQDLQARLDEAAIQATTMRDDADQAMDTMQEQLARAKQRAAANEADLIANADRIQADLRQAQGEIASQAEEINGLQSELEELAENNGRLQLESDRAKQLDARVAELAESLQRARDQITGLENSLANAQDANEQLIERTKDYDALQADNHQLHSNLQLEQARVATLEGGLESVQSKRGMLEKMLADQQQSHVQLSAKLNAAESDRDAAETKAEEMRRLWESEIANRNTLGKKMEALQQVAKDAEGKIEQEKRRTAKATEKKRHAEAKTDGLHRQIGDLRKENGVLEAQLQGSRDHIRGIEAGEIKPPALEAEHGVRIAALTRQLNVLQVERDEFKQAALEVTANYRLVDQEKQQATDALRRTERTLVDMTRERDNAEAELNQVHDEGHVPLAEVSQLRNQLETQSRQELNRKLMEVNHHLEEQARAEEVAQKEYEATIARLEAELTIAQANSQRFQDTVSRAERDARTRDLLSEPPLMRTLLTSSTTSKDRLNREQQVGVYVV